MLKRQAAFARDAMSRKLRYDSTAHGRDVSRAVSSGIDRTQHTAMKFVIKCDMIKTLLVADGLMEGASSEEGEHHTLELVMSSLDLAMNRTKVLPCNSISYTILVAFHFPAKLCINFC